MGLFLICGFSRAGEFAIEEGGFLLRLAFCDFQELLVVV